MFMFLTKLFTVPYLLPVKKSLYRDHATPACMEFNLINKLYL